MHVALWDSPAADCLASAAQSLGCAVERCDGAACDALVRAGQVDLGLVPTYYVLAAATGVEVLPGGALSSWSFPYAQLRLARPLKEVRTFVCSPDQVQEALMVRVILKEHYGMDVSAVPQGPADAELLTGTPGDLEPGILDLGREWFELSQYPMVWALFTCSPSAATPAMEAGVLAIVRRAEEMVWGTDTAGKDAYQDGLRLRLDDLAVAGLTGLREYMYYYGAIEEMAELPFYEPPESGVSEQVPQWAAE